MTDRFATANGIELCYRTHGERSAEPLLLVMGLGAQLTLWPEELCEGLVDRGFFVIRFDNRDTGLSSKLDDVDGAAAYLLTDFAADAVGLLDALDIESAHVVGASMGGMIAQTIAIEHRARVRTLTSIMSTTGEPDVGTPTPEALEVLLRPVATTREEAIESGVAARRAIGSPDHFDEATARVHIAATYDRCWNPAGTARHLLAIMASGSRAEGLRQVDAPTLVIHGDADPLVTPSGGHRTAELVPGAELLVLEGMGHDLPLPLLPPIIDAITSLAARATVP